MSPEDFRTVMRLALPLLAAGTALAVWSSMVPWGSTERVALATLSFVWFALGFIVCVRAMVRGYRQYKVERWSTRGGKHRG